MKHQSVVKKRILIVDDNPEIHKDFIKILSKNDAQTSLKGENILFGIPKKSPELSGELHYQVDSAYQGQEALELVRTALSQGLPYALAFIDMRMPPGWDGIETIKKIWEVDTNIQMVICSAYSDHSWEEITRELSGCENFLILKKPFEVIEISQLAAALTKKWELLANLHGLVKSRTDSLENLYSLSEATLESICEGILIVALDEHIVTYNTNFLKQWEISETVLKSEKSSVIFEKLSTQVNDPVFFLKRMQELVEKPRLTDIKEWKLKSGVTLALFTHPQYLNDKIIGVVYSFHDITEHKKLEKELLHQATHDSLTGLPNRALFLDRLKQAIAHAKRYHLHVGVVHIDVDFFKEINDTYGRNVGDLVLKCLANRMSTFIRETDTVARFGGDEFVIVFTSQIHEKNFIEIIKRFSEIFLKPINIEDHDIVSTVSIGVSIYPCDGEDVETLLKNADIAQYQAKLMGRNRFQFYIKEFNQPILQNSAIRAALGQALVNKELSLDYQPLVDLKTSQIIGVEALLRWVHPTMGKISPQVFIPIAEESGHIISIGEWVLRSACHQAKIWHQTLDFSTLKMSINVSAVQFREKNFVAVVKSILDETQFNPKCLELEITEGLILSNIKQTAEKMAALKKIGVRFAIDDFGTGYSSLSYLKYFQFDTVKIDKTFINNVTTDSANSAIVEAIIAITKNLGVDVLAEGVELKEQVAFLKEHHSNQVQGYYYSKPLNEAACTELLKHHRIIK